MGYIGDMILGIPLLVGLLAGDSLELDRQEHAAYSECRSARKPTTVWRVGVEDAWLRAGEGPESPARVILHRGQPVTVLKVGRSSTLVRVDEDRKGWLGNDDLVKRVYPPRDPRPVEECPQPSFLRAHPPINVLPLRGDPDAQGLEDLEVDRTVPGDAADTGAGRPR